MYLFYGYIYHYKATRTIRHLEFTTKKSLLAIRQTGHPNMQLSWFND
ncbi:hypothetical protein E2R55_09330 [Vibrio vulnificus]|nr:hypothetical protein E2R55_09330 [Vibrio vulnificus]